LGRRIGREERKYREGEKLGSMRGEIKLEDREEGIREGWKEMREMER
jgi:hypothetical protein